MTDPELHTMNCFISNPLQVFAKCLNCRCSNWCLCLGLKQSRWLRLNKQKNPALELPQCFESMWVKSFPCLDWDPEPFRQEVVSWLLLETFSMKPMGNLLDSHTSDFLVPISHEATGDFCLYLVHVCVWNLTLWHSYVLIFGLLAIWDETVMTQLELASFDVSKGLEM